jgi:hypothetical protein
MPSTDKGSKATNQRTVQVELNGQQEQLVKRMVTGDKLGRPAEELIRLGFLEFAKRKRLSPQ